MAFQACSHFNCMVADLTGKNSSLLGIQDIERLIQSSQFHFLPSVLLPTLPPPICRQPSYLDFMQASIHPKGKIIQRMHRTRENDHIAHFGISLLTRFSLHSPVWAVDRHELMPQSSFPLKSQLKLECPHLF